MKREQADREMQEAIKVEALKQGARGAALLFDGHAAMSGPLAVPLVRLYLGRHQLTRLLAASFEAGFVAGKNTEQEALAVVREQLKRDRARRAAARKKK